MSAGDAKIILPSATRQPVLPKVPRPLACKERDDALQVCEGKSRSARSARIKVQTAAGNRRDARAYLRKGSPGSTLR